MSKPVFVRSANPEETQMFFDWAKENAHGEFDPEVARFKSSITWCAYDKDGPLVFQTIQKPLMLESLAIRPGATDQQVASAVRELTQNAVTQAHLSNSGEIYFLGSSDRTNEFAANHIFEEVPMKVFRVKIKDLTKCS